MELLEEWLKELRMELLEGLLEGLLEELRVVAPVGEPRDGAREIRAASPG